MISSSKRDFNPWIEEVLISTSFLVVREMTQSDISIISIT
jgi:hypothetical protein